RGGPVVGYTVLVVLVLLLGGLILYPVILIFRLPPSLPRPKSITPEYLTKLEKRLRANPRISSENFSLETALDSLKKEADKEIKARAMQIFLATAISQSGRLDAFVVLATNLRMIYAIAEIYYNRPGLRDLSRLYTNVLVAVFLATEIDEIDFDAQIAPVLSSSLAGSLPVFNNVAALIQDSVLEGTANAYLALRIGILAREYCHALTKIDLRAKRRNASLEALKMLADVAVDGGRRTAMSFFHASKSMVQAIPRGIKSGVDTLIRQFSRKPAADGPPLDQIPAPTTPGPMRRLARLNPKTWFGRRRGV
ncbi:MAG: YcjF family protein, partial [Lentisphaeria bacterium]|nr:YcjF family protein [Candidatus Neomarinimicrobiota bacterium]MCF7843053.1 YcjF family protein [Lentisphaeria bacterium]